MKSNSFISIKEKRFLTIIASIIFSLTLLNLASIGIEDYNNSVKEKQEKLLHEANGNADRLDFTVYCMCRGSFVPLYRFFTLLLLPAIIFGKRFFVAIFFALLTLILFSYENYLGFYFASINAPELTVFEVINLIARPLDYVVFLLISILLIWQTSLLFRVFFNLFQGKTGLK